MIEIFASTLVALAILVLAAWLVRSAPSDAPKKPLVDEDSLRGLWDGAGLKVAERIFDPRDCSWLRDGLCFPSAAEALARHRKQLAVAWLKGLRHSFKELVRLPDPANPNSKASGTGAWQLLWLTLRFHLLLTYTLLVVRLFGPYHRLIPSFRWADSLRDHTFLRQADKAAFSSRFR